MQLLEMKEPVIAFPKQTKLFGREKSKLILSGWIKNMQQTLPYKENTFYNIPQYIADIVLSYYEKVESWNPNKETIVSVYRIIEERIDNLDICKTTIYNHNAFENGFGENEIKSGCHEWIFKILTIPDIPYKQYSIRFGITGCMTTWIATNAQIYPRYYQYGEIIKEQDTVKMIFDFDENTLQWIVNDNVYDIITIRKTKNALVQKHRMMIGLYGYPNAIQLLDYQQLK